MRRSLFPLYPPALIVLFSLLTVLFLAPGSAPAAPTTSGPPPGGVPLDRPMSADTLAPTNHRGPFQDADGIWHMPAGGAVDTPLGPQSIQNTGSDLYGHTSSAVSLNWIDATGGTDTGLSGYSSGQATGPIPLPFTFPFYEHSYTSVRIAASGYIAFEDALFWDSQFHIPLFAEPNNIVAPYATLLELSSSGPDGRVYYEAGGTAPNRYFVVEWHDVEYRSYYPNGLTFQVVLYENGDIVFQYQDMSAPFGRVCGMAGIEDTTGKDGLATLDFCQLPSSFSATRIHRPADAARVRVLDPAPGHFVGPGETVAVPIEVRNTGNLGADTYDVTWSSGWPVTLFAADGVTPLTDTDGDTVVDTGSVAQAATTTIVAQVAVPPGATAGDHNPLTVDFTSSLNPAKSAAGMPDLAVAAPFAMVVEDDVDHTLEIDLAQPGAVGNRLLRPRYDYPVEMALAATGTGFAAAWTDFYYNSQASSYEIFLQLTDPYGRTTHGPYQITDHSVVTHSTYDNAPTVAAAPNGTIGLAWYRYEWSQSIAEYRYNIYVALARPDGTLKAGPFSITGHGFGGATAADPAIAATADGRFVMAWRELALINGNYHNDIYYAVYAADGTQVKPPTRLVAGQPGSFDHYRPALTSGSGNDALITWMRREANNDDVWYAVINSAGNITRAPADLSVDENRADWWNYDVASLANGNFIAVWEAWGCNPLSWEPHPRYVLLDSSYNRIGSPQCLGVPNAASWGTIAAAVTGDNAGNAIVTWRDEFPTLHLYYAVIGANGNVRTPPMTMRTAQDPFFPYVEISYWGHSTAPYALEAPDAVDGETAFMSTVYAAGPGGTAIVRVRYDNLGTQPATNAELALTLASGLQYVGNSAGLPAMVIGQTVTFDIGTLPFVGGETFDVYVATPGSADIGDAFPISLTLTTAEPDHNPADNSSAAEVNIQHMQFLPTTTRLRPAP